MDPHGDGALGVVAEGFNPVHQVCRELVTSLQHAQHYDVIVTKVVHDVACEALRPVSDTSKLALIRRRKRLRLVYAGGWEVGLGSRKVSCTSKGVKEKKSQTFSRSVFH